MKEKRKIKVLQMIGELTSGGAESVITNLSNSIDCELIEFYVTARKHGPVARDLSPSTILRIIEKNRVIDFSHLKHLCDFIKHEGIDLIHSHLFGPNFYGALASKLTNTIHIMTIHGWDCLATRKRINTYRLMANISNCLVVVSDLLEVEAKQKLKLRNFPIRKIYNGIDIRRFSPSTINTRPKDLPFPKSDRIFVGTVGNVKPVKGHDVIIEALKILRDQGLSRVVIVIVGFIDQSQKTITIFKRKLDDAIKQWKLEGNVIFLGSRSDIPELLKYFDFFVLPSRSEGLPISLLEAMASKKPVLATRVGMNSKIISDKINGMLVSPEDPYAMAQALTRMIADPDESKKMGEKAFETVSKSYSADVMANTYESLYFEMLSGSPLV